MESTSQIVIKNEEPTNMTRSRGVRKIQERSLFDFEAESLDAVSARSRFARQRVEFVHRAPFAVGGLPKDDALRRVRDVRRRAHDEERGHGLGGGVFWARATVRQTMLRNDITDQW
jgi:hypothetical protein